MKKAITIICVICISGMAYAQIPETIASDRPGNAFSPLTVGKNIFQTQIGLEYGGSRYNNTEVSNYNFLTTYFRYGFSKAFEISAQIDYRYDRFTQREDNINDRFYSSSSLNGINNLGVGLRYNLLRSSGSGPDIGALLAVNFSNILEDYDTNNEIPTLTFVVQQSLPANFGLNVNLGASLVDPNREFLGIYVLNLGYGINNKWSVYIESYGTYDGTEFIDNYDAGLAYLFNKDIQLDFYGGATEYQNTFNYFLSAGVSIMTGGKT